MAKAAGFLRLLYHSAAPRVWRLVVAAFQVNDGSDRNYEFQAAADQRCSPSPSNREPEKGDQESRDRYDQERSVHVFNVPLGFYGRYVAAVTSVSHTVILETPAPFGTW